MGKKAMLIIDETDEGVHFRFRFSPEMHSEEISWRNHCTQKIIQVILQIQKKMESEPCTTEDEGEEI